MKPQLQLWSLCSALLAAVISLWPLGGFLFMVARQAWGGGVVEDTGHGHLQRVPK